MTFSEYLGIPEYRFSLQFGDYYFHKDYHKSILVNFKTKDSWRDIDNLTKTKSLHEQLQLPIEIPKTFLKHYLTQIEYDNHTIFNEILINGTDIHNLATLPHYLWTPTPDIYLFYTKLAENGIATFTCDMVTPEKFNLVKPN